MCNVKTEYNTFDPKSLMEKKRKIISSDEALKDIIPIEWDDEVLRGEKRIIVTNEEKR